MGSKVVAAVGGARRDGAAPGLDQGEQPPTPTQRRCDVCRHAHPLRGGPCAAETSTNGTWMLRITPSLSLPPLLVACAIVTPVPADIGHGHPGCWLDATQRPRSTTAGRGCEGKTERGAAGMRGRVGKVVGCAGREEGVSLDIQRGREGAMPGWWLGGCVRE